MSQERFIVVDVQGFHVANKLFAKEVCISDADKKTKTFLIQPPFKFSNLTIKEKNINTWLYYNLHGLSWDDGNSTLKELKEYFNIIMKEGDYPTVYVKGIEKVGWLKELLRDNDMVNVINLEDLICPNVRTMYKQNTDINICNFHRQNPNHMCAEKSVIIIRNFINSHIK